MSSIPVLSLVYDVIFVLARYILPVIAVYALVSAIWSHIVFLTFMCAVSQLVAP